MRLLTLELLDGARDQAVTTDLGEPALLVDQKLEDEKERRNPHLHGLRVVAEHRIARLTHFGARQARYFGSAKVLFQLVMTAALANLTLVASATRGGLFLYFLVALTLVLALAIRTRM